jgi:putative drug exporter of the RND superfamily
MSQSRSLLFDRWPRFIARHPWRVIGGALACIILFATLAATAGGTLVNTFSIPGTEAQHAYDLLAERFPQQSGDSAIVVVRAPAGLNTPQVHARVDTLVANLTTLPEVSGVVSPYQRPGAVSADGTIAQIGVQYAKRAVDLQKSSAVALVNLRDRASAPDFQVELSGQVVQAGQRGGLGSTETVIGLIAAVIILLIAFGSVVAMGLPIVTALVALGSGLSLVTLLAAFVHLPSFTTAFGAMIGLGVGIDYSLLIVTRFRQGLARGMGVDDALVTAVATAGRSVLFAGATVVVAMLGLWTVGIPFVSYLGTAAAIIVAMTILVAFTVLPAILRLLGRRVDGLRIPGIRASVNETETGIGYRLSRLIARAPVVVLAVSLGLTLLIAAPALRLQVGSSDAGTNPTSDTTRRAYDLLSEGFGVGYNGTILVAVRVDDPAGVGLVQQLPATLGRVAGVASTSPAQFNAQRTAATIIVTPTTSPQSEQTKDLVHRLRDETARTLAGSPAQAYIGGSVATIIDLGDKVSSRLPFFFLAVIGLSFLLLMAAFRSVLVPLKAALMNLLSIGAAFGVLVAIFQWGWLGGVFGVSKTGPVESFLPMMLFAILFGLSTDYEVFLVSRIHEEYLATGNNSEAVGRGLSATTRLITAAAAIMVAVFISFAFGNQRVIKEFGLGLASAILIDATVIRLLVVPAIMQLLGNANWWFPRWLDRIVPQVSLEAPAAVPMPTGAMGNFAANSGDGMLGKSPESDGRLVGAGALPPDITHDGARH